ncbi:MAG: NAD(P)-binding domain-containing protein, partial [Chloroflexota bacterium]|nr:NAD(P)-binding domain-containing protein [Chloroflexota bacterium]
MPRRIWHRDVLVNGSFAARVADRSAVIGIVGLGYVGMPMAMAYARAGFSVIGFDVDESRVEALRRGE